MHKYLCSQAIPGTPLYPWNDYVLAVYELMATVNVTSRHTM